MQKLVFSFFGLLLMMRLQAATFPELSAQSGEPVLNANSILLPIGNNGETISLLALSTISVKEFEALRGSSLSFFQKIGFKLAQRKLRNKINADGTVDGKLLKGVSRRLADENSKGLDAGWFFLGLFLVFFGVLLAYLVKGGNKKKRVKSAWIGFGVAAFIFLLFTVATAGFM